MPEGDGDQPEGEYDADMTLECLACNQGANALEKDLFPVGFLLQETGYMHIQVGSSQVLPCTDYSPPRAPSRTLSGWV